MTSTLLLIIGLQILSAARGIAGERAKNGFYKMIGPPESLIIFKQLDPSELTPFKLLV